MRPEKQLLLDEIQEKMDVFKTFIIARYQGIKANLANEFRQDVAKTGGDFEVVRKRIFIKAAEIEGIHLSPELFEGHIGVVFAGEDAVETIKTVFKFGKENPDAMNVLGGMIDGTLYGATEIEKLSRLPGKDQMRAQFLGLLEAPMSQTLAVMEALLTSIMHCLKNRIQKEQGD